MDHHISRIIASELGVKSQQIFSAIQLVDDGNTIPFIARYRKEATGGLDDSQLRYFEGRLSYLRELQARRETIIRSIEDQGKMNQALLKKINEVQTKTELEDIYLPFKPKRRTKGQIALEAGLGELAQLLWHDPSYDPCEKAHNYINSEHGFDSVKKVLEGARAIIIEQCAENAPLLALIRAYLQKNAIIQAQVVADREESGQKFKDYFNYSEKFAHIASHRALALFRGRDEGVLQLSLLPDDLEQKITEPEKMIADFFGIDDKGRAGDWWRLQVVSFAWKVKIALHLETQLMSELKERADREAIEVFGANLTALLMAAPAGNAVTMGLDPGIRTGVKVAIVDETGKVLQTSVIYPHTGKERESQAILTDLIRGYGVKLIAIGNGTASRETEKFTKDLLALTKLQARAVVVSEAGASVYSASEIAARECADLDVSLRGAVSIARRLQDPLAELVKIDPKALGVGQYQHDVHQGQLAKKLEAVVEDCVNKVGVDLNTASLSLLSRVSGLNISLAHNIVVFRDVQGKFTDRKQLMKVPRLGEKAFEQCAGFLKITAGDNPLDASSVHPESYPVVEKIIAQTKMSIEDLLGKRELLKKLNAHDFVDERFGLPTVCDILQELAKEGRDPRGDFKTATFKEGVCEITDLCEGMELEGVVTNVTNFGAFVDLGVHQDGLVHISHLSNRFVDDPNTLVKTGDIVKVWVLEVDYKRKRISLSMRGKNKGEQAVKKMQKSSHNIPLVGSAMMNAFAALKRK